MLVRTIVEPDVLAEMARIGEQRSPNEAGGVLLPYKWLGKQVIELPNHAEDPVNHIVMTSEDLVEALTEWKDAGHEWDQITVWHTHPAGQLGPSKEDLDNRTDEIGNLVVTLQEGGPPLATWF